ncbi:ArsC family reductase [Ectothiorhodospiraceae bacterium 2226]|nr:ArsC family reductase [Ectothiorhodospiraceae bacterium 2226]
MSDPAVLFGIRSCDTVRKARRWLDQRGVAYRYHDLRDDGVEPADLTAWCEALGWEALLNRRSTTWRGLTDTQRAAAGDAEGACALLRTHPTLLRRPLLAVDGRYWAGFDEAAYRSLLGQS